MTSRHHERVQERAYHLWRESGGEHGRAIDHWLQAEHEIEASEGQGEAETTRRSPRAAAAKAAPKSARKVAAPKKTEASAPGGTAKARSKRPASPA